MWSFIVPAHDEAALLGATLDAIQAAAQGLGGPFEVLVVDDASTDGTGAVAQAHGATVLPVAYRHIAATRNAGARAANGRVFVFVDADTLVDATVVAAAARALAAGAVAGGAAVRLPATTPAHARWTARFFATLFRWVRIAPGCFIYCTRDAFDAVGGFSEAYYAGEDVAISRAFARIGRVSILRESVQTSDRKLKTFSALEHLRLVLEFALRGRRLLTSREGLDLWYGARRKNGD